MKINLKNKKEKNENVGAGLVSARGITLIALVIIIILLIILAGVAISLSLGENGIFSKAKQAKQEYTNAQEEEKTTIAKYSNDIDEIVNGYRETTASNGVYIDTSKELATLALDTEYAATEDCVIVGTLNTRYYNNKRQAVNVIIDNVRVMYMGGADNTIMLYSPIYVALKKGQKIEFQSMKDTGFEDPYSLLVKAYGVL